MFPFQIWEGSCFMEQIGKTLFGAWIAPIFFALFILKHIFGTPDRSFQIGLTDISLTIFGIYLFVHILYIKPAHLPPFFIIETLTLVGFYLLVRLLGQNKFLWIFVVLLLTAFGQSIWGLLQYFSFLRSRHHDFPITGTFFNPAPYSGYLAAIIPINLGIMIFLIRFKSKFNKLFFKWKIPLQYVLISIFFLCILMLILTQSRAAWLAAIFSSFFLILPKIHLIYVWLKPKFRTQKSNSLPPNIRISLWKIFNLLLKHFFTVSILAIIGFLACYKLYQLRTESVDGRLLIWKSTYLMIRDNLITGVGAGQFNANYMHFQVRYLSNNHNPNELMLADNTIFAFNEFLRIAAEYGLFGLILILIVLISIFHRKYNPKHRATDIATAGIVSILIFGCFSYPGSVLPLKVLLVLYMGIVVNFQKPVLIKWFPFGREKYKLGFITKTTIVLVIILFLIFSFRWNYQFTGVAFDWKTASRKFSNGDAEQSIALCKKIYPMLKTDGFFMAMYGHFLKRAGNYDEAEKILKEAVMVQPTSDVYLCLGDCYFQQKQYEEAEKAYLYALKMVPSRVGPVSALARLYLNTGREQEACCLIEDYLRSKIKKQTIASYEIELTLIELNNKIKSQNDAGKH